MGRARAFDSDQALDRAMTVFWSKGYEGTSLSDLTEATGINRPSLYAAAFGNKQELFRKALERYGDGPSSYERRAMAQPTAREVAEGLLRGAADVQTDPRYSGRLPRRPRHHLLRRGLFAGRQDRDRVPPRRPGCDPRALRATTRADGDLPADADPQALTHYLSTVVCGMAVQAASGATAGRTSNGVIELTMRAWPQ